MSENSLLLLVLLLYNRENNKPRLVWRSCQQRVNCCKPRLGMSSSLEVGRVARSTARERGSVFPLSWRVGRTKLTITQAATYSPIHTRSNPPCQASSCGKPHLWEDAARWVGFVENLDSPPFIGRGLVWLSLLLRRPPRASDWLAWWLVRGQIKERVSLLQVRLHLDDHQLVLLCSYIISYISCVERCCSQEIICVLWNFVRVHSLQAEGKC